MKRVFACLALAACVLALGGCATGDAPSTIPWNQPTAADQGGALGSALGH